MHTYRLAILCVSVASCLPLSGAAPEPWADRRLPVRDGLELWLDAARESAARSAGSLLPIADGGATAIFHDGSGARRHLLQRRGASQPRWRTAGLRDAAPSPASAVRFDGEDDSLQAAGLRLELEGLTLFLVAAPASNTGYFRALISANALGANDYTTGFNVDLGPAGSTRFENLNVEGRGFPGVQDLLRSSFPFKGFHVLALTSAPGGDATRLYADGAPQGTRGRAAGKVTLDEITLGARFYSNDKDPPRESGFFAGEIAEVILYSRVLSDTERAAVERYLFDKHAPLIVGGPAGAAEGVPLRIEPPGGGRGPAVEALVPGFTVRELPIELTNINNVRYREDGVLVALGYDGRVHLLTDTNGDGVEDRAEPFWDRGGVRAPIGMALTPPGYTAGRGVFVASKGKVSLMLDADADGRAETERVVASGWQELSHGVDALGVAIDRDGSVYFGLGCTDFTNAYLVDAATGKSGYRLSSERGTILKVAPDFSRREIVCTGIRFPVALAFNRNGDLFATDQEGATWLPGGNPLDELLHIERGRHYGFPPRHPQHLPDVVDEPAAFLYGPQHQSTCGLVFNEGGPGDKAFGPAHWGGDAFVTGYSRGKIYRTKVVKTPAGYVAQSSIFLCVGPLAVDACPTLDGSALVVASHGGEPDWGTGPQGEGKIFKVAYTGREMPQPVAAWPDGPLATRVAFDRPLDPAAVARLAERPEIVYGDAVRAGDRFEVHRPGYQVVQEDVAEPRRALKVVSANLSHDGRTLILGTAAHPARTTYALRLPDFPAGTKGIELDYTLSGVEVAWQTPAGPASRAWSGWLPHLDLDAALALLAGSSEAEEAARLLAQPGRLTLRARVDLESAKAIEIECSVPFEAALGGSSARGEAGRLVSLDLPAAGGEPALLEVSLATGGSPRPRLNVAWRDARDAHRRPLPPARLLLPWTPAPLVRAAALAGAAAAPAPELAGGNWLRGRKVFLEEGQCAKCHRARGEGQGLGPDLSNLVFRDPGSVLRDITQPSAAINPDFVTYVVATRDRAPLVGFLRTEGSDRISLVDAQGQTTVLDRKSIASITPSSVSTMPQDIEKTIGPAKLRDLLTFLLTPAPRMPEDREGAPPLRARAEVAAALAAGGAAASPPASSGTAAAALRPLKLVLLACEKDHGPGEHDYPAWQRVWSRLMAMAEGTAVETAWDWPSAQQLREADVIIAYFWNHAWSNARAAELDAFLARGGGLVLLHSAVIADRDEAALSERIGIAWKHGFTKFRHGPLHLELAPESAHPILRGLRAFDLIDESYWPLEGRNDSVSVLATGIEEEKPRPLVWTCERRKGRVFATVLGHYSWTFDDPLFRLLVLRGIAWTAGEPLDRFNDLVTPGARVQGN